MSATNHWFSAFRPAPFWVGADCERLADYWDIESKYRMGDQCVPECFWYFFWKWLIALIVTFDRVRESQLLASLLTVISLWPV
jgi:hypothetical protein